MKNNGSIVKPILFKRFTDFTHNGNYWHRITEDRSSILNNLLGCQDANDEEIIDLDPEMFHDPSEECREITRAFFNVRIAKLLHYTTFISIYQIARDFKYEFRIKNDTGEQNNFEDEQMKRDKVLEELSYLPFQLNLMLNRTLIDNYEGFITDINENEYAKNEFPNLSIAYNNSFNRFRECLQNLRGNIDGEKVVVHCSDQEKTGLLVLVHQSIIEMNYIQRVYHSLQEKQFNPINAGTLSGLN